MITASMDFQQAGIDSYRLLLLLPVSKDVLKSVLAMAINATKAITPIKEEKEVNSFEVPPMYYNTINTYCKPLINKDVAKEINPDGVFIKTHNVTRCIFEKQPDGDYIAKVWLEGIMLRKG